MRIRLASHGPHLTPLRGPLATALALLTLLGGACDERSAKAPLQPQAPRGPVKPAPRHEAPAASPPLVQEGDRLVEVPVTCGGTTLYGLAARTWERAGAPGQECAALWTVGAAPDGVAWVSVHCLPAQRVGLAQLDAWYGLFRTPDGGPLPEVGKGRASIGATCGSREVGIDPRGTLVSPIACIPAPSPGHGLALRRRVLELEQASFVFDLLGPPAMLAAERSDVWGGRRWFSSIAADFASFVSSMRARSSPSASSAFARPCP